MFAGVEKCLIWYWFHLSEIRWTLESLFTLATILSVHNDVSYAIQWTSRSDDEIG